MGPWSAEPKRQTNVLTRRVTWPELAIGLFFLLLLAFGGTTIWINRYELGQVGGIPVRMNRFTGEVIGCVAQGCFAMVPAGEPPLGKLRPVATPSGSAAGPEAGLHVGAPGAHVAAPAGNAAASGDAGVERK